MPLSAGRQPRSAGLDVVRSAAILMVLVSHSADSFAAWAGGRPPVWVALSGAFGVELFFVLSGFLIGRLLLRIVDEGPTIRAWAVFMVRRWMRTLPAYLLWLGFLALFWPPRFWEPGYWARSWNHVLRFGTLTQNLAWPPPDGWFGVSWSLTVEEWFYLGFSATLFAAVVLLGRRAGFWAACASFLIVPVLLRWGVPDSASFGEVLSKIAILRLDAIAFGVVLAWMGGRNGLVFRHPRVALAVGVGLILWLWSGWFDRFPVLDLHMRRTVWFDVASLGFALCLPAAVAMRRLPHVADTVFRAISRQSYAIYLTHLSILEIAGYYRDLWHAPAWAPMVAAPMLTWGLSWASWRWIEAPILARRPRQQIDPQPPGWPPHPHGAPDDVTSPTQACRQQAAGGVRGVAGRSTRGGLWDARPARRRLGLRNQSVRPRGRDAACRLVRNMLVGIGGLTLDPTQAGTHRMRRFYVHSSFRGQGFGRAVAIELLERAWQLGVPVTVNAATRDGPAFWERLGLIPDARQGHSHVFRHGRV